MNNKIIRFAIAKCTTILHGLNMASPVMMLLVRLYMAQVFFLSGLQKIRNWDNTISLFTSEHPVPFLPPQVAAVMSSMFELSCPVLLTLGLAARLATLPVLGMTAVIYFTYDHSAEVCEWFLLYGMILFYGPGKLSFDHLISKKLKGAAT